MCSSRILIPLTLCLLAAPGPRVAAAREQPPCPKLRGTYPSPRWTDLVALTSLAGVKARLAARIRWPSGSEQPRRRSPTSCKEFLALADEGKVDLVDATDEQILAELTLRCRPLALLGKARPSPRSHLRALRLDRQPLTWLPPLNVQSSSEVEKLKKQPRSWGSHDAEAKVSASCATRAVVTTSHDDTEVRLVALGDLDGDGIEDALLHVDNDLSRGGGSMRTRRLVLATRRRPGALLEVLREWF